VSKELPGEGGGGRRAGGGGEKVAVLEVEDQREGAEAGDHPDDGAVQRQRSEIPRVPAYPWAVEFVSCPTTLFLWRITDEIGRAPCYKWLRSVQTTATPVRPQALLPDRE
jgi:hypothetical protein